MGGRRRPGGRQQQKASAGGGHVAGLPLCPAAAPLPFISRGQPVSMPSSYNDVPIHTACSRASTRRARTPACCVSCRRRAAAAQVRGCLCGQGLESGMVCCAGKSTLSWCCPSTAHPLRGSPCSQAAAAAERFHEHCRRRRRRTFCCGSSSLTRAQAQPARAGAAAAGGAARCQRGHVHRGIPRWAGHMPLAWHACGRSCGMHVAGHMPCMWLSSWVVEQEASGAAPWGLHTQPATGRLVCIAPGSPLSKHISCCSRLLPCPRELRILPCA